MDGQNLKKNSVKKMINLDNDFAKEIRLIPRFSHLVLHEKNHIDIVTIPMNAKDSSSFIWTTSNTDVVQIDNKGNIIALQAGKATIQVSGEFATAFIEVEVNPPLQKLYFQQKVVRIRTGNSMVINCDTDPSNVFSGNFRWEIDNKSIASCNPSKDGKKCQILASLSYEGKGNIRCYDPETRLSAICNLEVYSSVPQNWRGQVALISMLIGLFAVYTLLLSIGISVWGIIKDHEKEHKKRYILCIIGSILILLASLR